MLFTDWTLLRLFPPLRAMWAEQGTQAVVHISGYNAKRVLFGAINARTARRAVYIAKNAASAQVREFLKTLRRAYRRAGTIWLLADRATGHTAAKTRRLAEELNIQFLWLPKQWPELNAMDQLWRELKTVIAANRQARTIDALAAAAALWVLTLTPKQARDKAGMNSEKFWLRQVLQDFCRPT